MDKKDIDNLSVFDNTINIIKNYKGDPIILKEYLQLTGQWEHNVFLKDGKLHELSYANLVIMENYYRMHGPSYFEEIIKGIKKLVLNALVEQCMNMIANTPPKSPDYIEFNFIISPPKIEK